MAAPPRRGRLDLQLGFHCNNRCAFCLEGDRRDREPPRPMEALRANLEAARARGTDRLSITGGEPTVHTKVLEVISLARRLGFTEIEIQTNGRRFHYDLFARAAVDAGATEFSPALHGSTEAVHDALTQAPGSFRQTVQGIENLVALGQRVVTNTVITSTNYTDLPKLAARLVDLGVDGFRLTFVHVLGSAEVNASWLVPRLWEVMPFVYQALDIGRDARLDCGTEAIPYCLMEGYEELVSDASIPTSLLVDADRTVDEADAATRNAGRGQGPPCATCKWRTLCPGPWEEYVELFGWDEFTPMG